MIFNGFHTRKVIEMSQKKVNALMAVDSASVLEKSVSDFKLYAKQTALGILEMGRVVYEAKTSLRNSDEFAVFCKRVGYESNSSSIKKLKRIGEKYVYLKTQAQHLPNNWTSLYEISGLTESTLNDLISKGLIHQNVLGAEIKMFLKNQSAELIEEGVSNTQVKEVLNGTGYGFECQLENVTDLAFKAQLQMIIENLKRMKVKVVLSKELKSALQPPLAKAA